MIDQDAHTWPEQNAVDEWLEKYQIKVPDRKSEMELKEAVTKWRLQIQAERDAARAELEEWKRQGTMMANQLGYVLPMAIGWANTHDVGSNNAIVSGASDCLAAFRAWEKGKP